MVSFNPRRLKDGIDCVEDIISANSQSSNFIDRLSTWNYAEYVEAILVFVLEKMALILILTQAFLELLCISILSKVVESIW